MLAVAGVLVADRTLEISEISQSRVIGQPTSPPGDYFAGKLRMIMDTLHWETHDTRRQIHQSCLYLLWIFDHPELAEHIARGSPLLVGQRWIERTCAAALRVMIATAEWRPDAPGLEAGWKMPGNTRASKRQAG
jgi:hypothetical protein